MFGIIQLMGMASMSEGKYFILGDSLRQLSSEELVHEGEIVWNMAESYRINLERSIEKNPSYSQSNAAGEEESFRFLALSRLSLIEEILRERTSSSGDEGTGYWR